MVSLDMWLTRVGTEVAQLIVHARRIQKKNLRSGFGAPANHFLVWFGSSSYAHTRVSLAVHQTLKLSRVSLSLNIDCRDGIVNGLEIVGRQFHTCAAKIFFEPVQLRGSRNRHDPCLLREQPRQSNLRL